MDAIHVNSTAPFIAKRPHERYTIEKAGLYTEVISALCWRRENGRIYMITDDIGAEYYRCTGLGKIWDDVLSLIPGDLDGIDPKVFWAAGKLFALRDMPFDAALVDEDFIVWKKLSLSQSAVTVAHREYLSSDIYPDPRVFGVYDFPLMYSLDMSALPCNTAFLWIPDRSLRLYYTNQAIAFMKCASRQKSDDRLCRMVFAEQRLLGMLCAQTNTPVETLLDADRLFIAQDDYTHIWGAKQAMRDNPDYREEFLARCRKRILSDFPEYSFAVEAIENCGS